MNLRIIRTLIEKDAILYFRDRLFALITVLSLVIYVAIYFLLPNDVDETFSIALYAESAPEIVSEPLAGEGVSLTMLDSEDAVRNAVEDGDYVAGVILPPSFDTQLASKAPTTLTLVLPADAPNEQNDAVAELFEPLGYAIGGVAFNVQIEQEIIGEDRVGRQIAPRDRLVPLFAIFVLITEMMGLASLIASEIQGRTIRALLTSPTRVTDFLTAKGIFGVALAFSQVTILLLITGGLANQPLLMLLTILLGALLVTAVAFLIASVATSFLEIVAWSILIIVVFALPGFSVMFPGALSGWIEVIPTFYLVDTVHQIANFDAGWSNVSSNLATLLAVSAVLLAGSVVVLQRKFQ
jgi:ABC-2 type transport system permease protein